MIITNQEHTFLPCVPPTEEKYFQILQDGQPGTAVPTNNAVTVSQFVGTFKRFCNREYAENIWQRSYYDHVIRNQQDYNECWDYVDKNPMKWLLDHNAEP